jgi:hypothetical protein
VKEDFAYIKSIDGKAALNTKDGNTFRFLRSALQGQKQQSLARTLNTVNQEMDLNVQDALRTADFLDKTDPDDVNHRNNRLTGKGQYKKNLDNLAKARKTVVLAALYDKEMARADAPDRKPQLEKIDKATAGFKEKYKIALNSVHMPKARSDDSKLHKAVGDVYYLYANTFKYYYSGDPQTAVKVWILNRRFQSSQILKENIEK